MGETVTQLRARRRKTAEPTSLLTINEVHERLHVSVRTLRRWVADNKIPHVRPDPDSNLLRFPADAVDEWWRKRVKGVD